MGNAKPRGDVVGLEDVIPVVPDFVRAKSFDEAVGDEVSWARKGCFTIGC